MKLALQVLALGALNLALFTSSHAAAQCPGDDIYEDNDSWSTAVVLPVGVTTGLVFHGQVHPSGIDRDFWIIANVPADYVVTVEVAFTLADGILLGELSEAMGTHATIHPAPAPSNVLKLALPNTTGAVEDFRMEVWGASDDIDCNEYSINISIADNACLTASDDSFEDNDSFDTAAALTPGIYTDLFAKPSDDDYFKVSVLPGEIIIVEQMFTSATTGLYLLERGTCLTSDILEHDNPTGVNSASYENTSSVTQEVVLRCVNRGDLCARYDLSIAVNPGPCHAMFDDWLEPNDTCFSASSIGPWLYPNLMVDVARDDYYAIQVPAGQVLTIDYPSDQAVKLELYDDSTCTTPVGILQPSRTSWINQSGSMQTVHVRVYLPYGCKSCRTYNLNVALTPDPCQNGPSDDAFEDNETCAAATVLLPSMNMSMSLFVQAADHDFFEITVPAGASEYFSITSTNHLTTYDIYTFEDAANCADLVGGWITLFSAGPMHLVPSIGLLSNKFGTTPKTYYVLVTISVNSATDCGTYDFWRDEPVLPINTGLDPFCAGDGSANAEGVFVNCPCNNNSASGSGRGCQNSQGQGALLTTNGVPTLDPGNPAEDLSFTVTLARPDSPYLILQGSNAIAIPFKDGILCMGNPTERLDVSWLDGSGNSTTNEIIDVAENLLPGDRRYYQVWYRDPNLSVCGTGSNFTNGIAVSWRP